MSAHTRAARATLGAALTAAVALAGCGEGDDWGGGQPVPAVTLTPQALTARVGDSVAVVATLHDTPRQNSTATWRSQRPEIVRLDTTVAPGRIATGVAVAPGSVVLTVSVTHAGQTVTASIPATVLPR